MKYFLLTGRVLFSLIFISSGFFHFSQQSITYATMHWVPMAEILVPFSGLMAILGGFSIAIGYRTKIGAWILVAFLIPVTIYMHPFWAQQSFISLQFQMAAFMKNIALLGTALCITYFGAGSLSLDNLLRWKVLGVQTV